MRPPEALWFCCARSDCRRGWVIPRTVCIALLFTRPVEDALPTVETLKTRSLTGGPARQCAVLPRHSTQITSQYSHISQIHPLPPSPLPPCLTTN